jgi:formate hydrogenlyase subunit 6/NADH:ubiquinone oxidoreductase subunit I
MRKEITMEPWALPEFNLELCTACGLCQDYCPTGALKIIDAHPAMVSPENCAYCGICDEMCPEGAVILKYEII